MSSCQSSEADLKSWRADCAHLLMLLLDFFPGPDHFYHFVWDEISNSNFKECGCSDELFDFSNCSIISTACSRVAGCWGLGHGSCLITSSGRSHLDLGG